MSYYGELPISLGIHEIECREMMFYQYLPIKLSGQAEPKAEQRLNPFSQLIGICNCDYIGRNGLDAYISSNIYLTVKHLYARPGCPINRPGYHSDGFMTDDINYIWCDKFPTVFNKSNYALTMHHEYSLHEMEDQSVKENEVVYREKELLRLNQFNIHRVADVEHTTIRTFFKLSFSRDKYNLEGNSRNFLLDYNWEMKPREDSRNHPTKLPSPH